MQIEIADSLGVVHKAHRGSELSGITLYAGSNQRRNDFVAVRWAFAYTMRTLLNCWPHTVNKEICKWAVLHVLKWKTCSHPEVTGQHGHVQAYKSWQIDEFLNLHSVTVCAQGS